MEFHRKKIFRYGPPRAPTVLAPYVVGGKVEIEDLSFSYNNLTQLSCDDLCQAAVDENLEDIVGEFKDCGYLN